MRVTDGLGEITIELDVGERALLLADLLKARDDAKAMVGVAMASFPRHNREEFRDMYRARADRLSLLIEGLR